MPGLDGASGGKRPGTLGSTDEFHVFETGDAVKLSTACVSVLMGVFRETSKVTFTVAAVCTESPFTPSDRDSVQLHRRSGFQTGNGHIAVDNVIHILLLEVFPPTRIMKNARNTTAEEMRKTARRLFCARVAMRILSTAERRILKDHQISYHTKNMNVNSNQFPWRSPFTKKKHFLAKNAKTNVKK